jgi:hypothetical protein
MRLFWLVLTLAFLWLEPQHIFAKPLGQEQGQDQNLEPPSPLPPPQQEQGYVRRSWREREAPEPVRLPASPLVPASYFVGRWGQVSFNSTEDLPKMRKIAREYCNLPVTISLKSPTTFGMYVTTESKEVEVYEQNGSLYVIPVEQLGDGLIRGARELHVLDESAFTLRYLEEEAHRRYGPNLFVRCGAEHALAKEQSKEEKPQSSVKNKKPRKHQRPASKD